MRKIERMTRAEIRGLPEPARASALAGTAVELARRLDADPADTTSVLLARELRMTMVELHRQAGDTSDDLDRFLASINNPAFRGPGD